MQYFKEYLYNVKLNNLLIGGENKLVINMMIIML
jgi:hypothetical protein